MDEQKLVSMVMDLGEKMDKKKLASLISYFSITQGKESKNTPNLSLFGYGDEPRFINWMKSNLNLFGFSTGLYNEGVEVLLKLEEVSESNTKEGLFKYVKAINPYERWPFLTGEIFKIHIIYEDNMTCCKFDKNGAVPIPMEEREVFMDLYSLAKFAKAIQLVIEFDDTYYDEILDIVVKTAFLHEKNHLEQDNFHKNMNIIIDFKKRYKGKINSISALEILRVYLAYEYEAWEKARFETRLFYIPELVSKKLCFSSLASIVTNWMQILYEDDKISVYPEGLDFDIDVKLKNDKIMV